jgi:putative ABC transport system substrate-binding protein
MNRRAFISAVTLGVGAWHLTAQAQQPGKVYRVGHLAATAPSPQNTRLLGAFHSELRDRGWVEGRNITFEYRWAEGRYDRLPHLAAELADAKVDLIVAGGTPNALAARNASQTIPIVMVGATAPIEMGLVKTLARPGGNVTGVTIDVDPEQAAKLVELMVEIPGVSRIALLSSPSYPGGERYRNEIERAAIARQRAIRFIDVLRPEDFDQAFSAVRQMTPSEGLIVMADQLVQTRGVDIARLATGRKVATVFGGPGRPFVAAGGLMSQSADSDRYWRQAATYVDRILKGASPADLPVEQPTSFELVINLKTARALGLTLPRTLLLRADHVIE